MESQSSKTFSLQEANNVHKEAGSSQQAAMKSEIKQLHKSQTSSGTKPTDISKKKTQKKLIKIT